MDWFGANHRANSLGLLHHVNLVFAARKDNQEIIVAVATNGFVGSDRRTDSPGRFLQHSVARKMAVGVIDSLESVQVGKWDA